MMTSIIIGSNKEEVKIIYRDSNGKMKTYCLSSLDDRKGVGALLTEIDRMEKILNEAVLEKLDCTDKMSQLRASKRKDVRQSILSEKKTKIQEVEDIQKEESEKKVETEDVVVEKKKKKKENK